MKINWRTPPSNFLDSVELKRVQEVASLLALESCNAIESYTMSPDGPVVSSVFIVDVNYLCEVHLTSKSLEFDVCAAHTVLNYRVKFGDSTGYENVDAALLDEETDENRLDSGLIDEDLKSQGLIKFIEITLRHSDKMVSRLSYFGENINDWLEFFIRAYPPKFLLKNVNNKTID